MPMYEYECAACGHRFERIQKFSDPPVDECPSCGEPKVRKLLSSPAIQFKGSGWYITDYAKKGSVGDAKETGKSSESKESGKESGKESKESRESKESKESKESTKSTKSTESKSTTPASGTTSSPKASGE